MRRCGRALLLALALNGVSAAAQNPAAEAARTQAATATRAVQPSPAQSSEFGRAVERARKILERDEFQQAEPSWWDRQLAKMRGWLGRIFMGVDQITTSVPWLGRLMEWVLFMAAAVGLLVWALRALQRQRLRMTLGAGAIQAATQWARDTADWRRIAEEAAGRSAWREAIHALYWAAIVHLEQRRAWRHNPARTPREYVRLLRAGSREQAELRQLTMELERSWYGVREARAEEYESARASFESLLVGSMPGEMRVEATGGGA